MRRLIAKLIVGCEYHVMGITKQQLMDIMYSDVFDWFEAKGEPYKLRFLAQKYTSTARLLGVIRVLDLVKQDPRFEVRIADESGYLIAPKDRLRIHVDLEFEGKPERYWRQFNVSV